MMQTNEALIVHFFNDYRNNSHHSSRHSVPFIFNALENLAANKDVTKSFMFNQNNIRPQYASGRSFLSSSDLDVNTLKSLSGLDYSFILEGSGQPFKQQLARLTRDERFDDEFLDNEPCDGNSFFNSNPRNKQDISKYGKEAMATIKFVSKCRSLYQQMHSVIQYMIGYYSYSLSVDYSTLLKQWEQAVPSLHMTCAKEVKELNKIIESTYESNKFFKTRYETFVDFVVKSGDFVDMFMAFTEERHSAAPRGFENSRGYSNFFGHQGMPVNRPVGPVLNEKFKELFAEQERMLTDFIESNKDILVSREAHELFNQDMLIADYKKVLKICEILIEKTDIHMNCKSLLAIRFLDTYASRHEDIMKATDFDAEFRDLNIVAAINNIKNSSITAAIVFDDKSVAVKKKGYEGFQYSPSSFIGTELVLDGYMDEINHMLRKNPSMNKSVKVLMRNLRTKHVNNQPLLFSSLKGLKVGLKSYFDNENILKVHSFDMINELKTSRTFEEFDDKIHKVVRKHKIEQYAMSIVSNKYKNLYSDKTLSIMEELYDMGISTHILQDMIGKKMASIKNTRSLNAALKSLLNSINGFEISNIKMKAAANNVKVLFETEDYLVLEIDTFKQSKAMGSPSWCISREDYHFSTYTEGGNIQIFAYDFSLTSKDNKSIVGITLTRNMKVHAAHNKNDTELRDKATKEKVIKIVADAKGIVLKEHKPKSA
jgi:hypothetical protein